MDRIAGKMGVRKFYALTENFFLFQAQLSNTVHLACNWPNGTFATTKLSEHIFIAM